MLMIWFMTIRIKKYYLDYICISYLFISLSIYWISLNERIPKSRGEASPASKTGNKATNFPFLSCRGGKSSFPSLPWCKKTSKRHKKTQIQQRNHANPTAKKKKKKRKNIKLSIFKLFPPTFRSNPALPEFPKIPNFSLPPSLGKPSFLSLFFYPSREGI